VPKPVLVAPLQVTVLPDWTHAATAGPAGIATTVVSDSTNGAASVNDRSGRAFALDTGKFIVVIRAAPFVDVIRHSQVVRPKQPSLANWPDEAQLSWRSRNGTSAHTAQRWFLGRL
jgi:hypothetical protein